MNVRRLIVPVVFAGLVATWACVAPEEPPRAEEKAKTTAELLVGTWKLYSLNGVVAPSSESTLIEYKSDGSYTITSDTPKNRGTKNGTYMIEGDILYLHSTTDFEIGQNWRRV